MAQLATKGNGLIIAAFVVVLGLVGLIYTRYDSEVRAAQGWVQHSHEVIGHIKDLMLAVEDAETGQRGFLLTGRGEYLSPYTGGRDRSALLFSELRQLTVDNAAQETRLQQLSPLIQQKLEELAQTIELRRSSNLDAALAVVNSDRGRRLMQGIRDILADMTNTEDQLLRERLASADELRRITGVIAAGGGTLALLLFIAAAAMLHVARQQQRAAEASHREAASQLRASFDSLSQGIAVFDGAWRLASWNQCFLDLLAVPGSLAQRGTTYNELVALFATPGEFLETEAQVREGDRQHHGIEPIVYHRSRPDGRSFELRRTPMPTGGFAVTFTDITTQLEAERTQRESQKMRALGELTGGVAHDFNNLLTVITGSLDLMQKKVPNDDEIAPFLATALRGAERGAALTSQLLSFGRRQTLAPRPINLNKLVSELAGGMLQRTLGERINTQFVEAASLWPAFADPAQVESAVLNLALNARDAMPDSGKLTIETANVTLDAHYAQLNAEVEAGQYVMIAVSDTGGGMAPEVIARAFEPFFTTKSEGKGSGLGLAMVHGFAKQSKGHVKIYSEPGQGTTVKLYLPRSQRAIAEDTLAPVRLPTGSATILVVEDDADVRRIAVAQLRDLGYHVLDAEDAEGGLKVFSETARIDLLLTDVVLPGRLRGKDLAGIIRRASPSTRVLFMSGYTENAIVHDGKLDEGIILLSKPFRRDELAIKVAIALDADAKGPSEAADGDNVIPIRDRPH